ncbi:MAG: rhomboid family intramembrane serine protease, partial [Defluviitaleaceae bacterium]|nr:rhomboid family intramembrane serine protease [Defluviitaleaceae bacterium]
MKKTYDDFTISLDAILKRAGYVEVRTPVSFLNLWAGESHVGVHIYISYNMEDKDAESLKAIVDSLVMELLKQLPRTPRYWVIFNIFFGEGEYPHINAQESFDPINGGQHDVFFAVDGLRVRYNPKGSAKVNKALDKIEEALEGEGAKTLKDKVLAPAKFPIFSCLFIAINIIMFIVLETNGGSQDVATLLRFGAAHYHLTFTNLELYRLVSPIFLHIGFVHLFFNTTWIWIAGSKLERHVGSFKFLLLYIISGVVGNV